LLVVLAVASAVTFAGGRGAGAAGETPNGDPGQNFVPSVVGAFNGLSKRPDALGFSREGLRGGTTCKHYQGEARANGSDGTPYLFLTKSGNKSICVLQDDEPGYLFVAQMGSRNKKGERMGTNLLPYGSNDFSAFPSPLATFAQDKIVRELVFDGSLLPAYRHPGGMQLVGDVLAIGAEEPFNGETSRATIVFLKVTDPAHPEYLGRFDPPDLGDPLCGIVEDDDLNCAFGTDPIGMTAVRGTDGACCRYLIIAAGGPGNEQVRFFLSKPTSSTTDTTNLKILAHETGWDEVGRYPEHTIEDCLGADWPTAGLIQGGQHQMLNFVRQGNLDGQLYLIGGRRDGTIATPFVDELIDLYQVNLEADGTPGDCPFTHVVSKTLDTEAWANEGLVSGFAAAAGVYVSPTGEFLIYSTRHEAKIDVVIPQSGGPLLLADHVVVGEYRISSLVRANSPITPTRRPSATVDGPVAVDEGSSVQLTGHGEQALEQAFVQLFEDGGSGLTLPGILDDDEWFNIEFRDRLLDHFDQLDQIASDADDIDENAGSLRWFAPTGCTISLNDYPRRSDEWPGEHTILLRGTGRVEEEQDLHSIDVYRPADEIWPVSPVPAGVTPTSKNYNDDIGGVTFYHQVAFGGGVANRHDCEGYYGAPIGLGWDLDNNGSFEVSGATATFGAQTLDGPTTRTVKARGQHPTDTTALGRGDPFEFSVSVRNVPPQIGSATVVDSLGRDLAGGANPALVGLPVKLSVSFTDPGVADTQTGRVTWGDGTSNTSFTTFTDAHGGANGHLEQAHVFSSPGTHTIATTITDDDGGATTVERTVEVLSLEDAIEQVADELTDLIAQATNPRVASALRSARDELIGNHTGQPPTNGALDKLQANDPVGAITKLQSALDYLITAESRGAGNLTSLKDLIGLVAEGIATGAYERAKALLGTPSSGQARTLATIADLIARGHTKLAAHQYAGACDDFRQATSKAVSLRR
jgi:hypothetical protein